MSATVPGDSTTPWNWMNCGGSELPTMNGEDGRAISALGGHEVVLRITHIVGLDIIVSAALVLMVILIYRLATTRVRRRSRSSQLP
ncbi:MAG TPA: hypothetical protein VKB62_07685 [Streptosporangiaceae bacterium]|nr:hypothetical protein [Streptosporangiaceae bacterium]